MHFDVTRVLATALLGLLPCSAFAEISHLEPPFWWQGFEHRELQLLVHGEGLADFEPVIDHAGVTVSRIQPGDSPNYLFVYLDISPDAETGEFDIAFESGSRSLTHRYTLYPRDPDPARTGGFSPKDVIYLITPDRYANGDPGNDFVASLGDAPDRGDPYGRHGGDIDGLQETLDYIADMGFTQVWLNPLLENAMPEASYHGYATTDFYAVDPRFGSNEQYRKYVAEARQKGLGVIMDMIANHSGSNHWWMEDLPTDDWINSPFTDAADALITSHMRTTNQDPYAAEIDRREFADGWFVPAMPDLNQRNPLLADYLVQNAIWWIEYLGLSGIRMDTYPYPDKDYMTEWTRRIMQEYPGFNIVGEEWSPSPAITSYWQAGKDNHDGYESWLPSVMDFPLQIVFAEALNAPRPEWGSVWTPVYEMLGHDFLYPDPFNLVIFPDNHDMSRIYTQLDEDDDLYRMAIVFYLTMRGIPQIYYGTEIKMANPGTTSHGVIRSDFPGGWEGDRRNAFTGEGLDEKQRSAQAFMRKLLNWRKHATVIHEGALMQFAPVGPIWAYSRYTDDDTVLVVFNHSVEAQTVDMRRFAERVNGYGIDVISGNRYNLERDLVMAPRSVLLLESRSPEPGE